MPENLVLQVGDKLKEQALGIGNRLGSFEKGKEPGLNCMFLGKCPCRILSGPLIQHFL